MSNTVTAFTTAVTSDALWGVVADAVPILAIAIPFALGFWIYRRLTKGIGKAKIKP